MLRLKRSQKSWTRLSDWTTTIGKTAEWWPPGLGVEGRRDYKGYEATLAVMETFIIWTVVVDTWMHILVDFITGNQHNKADWCKEYFSTADDNTHTWQCNPFHSITWLILQLLLSTRCSLGNGQYRQKRVHLPLCCALGSAGQTQSLCQRTCTGWPDLSGLPAQGLWWKTPKSEI